MRSPPLSLLCLLAIGCVTSEVTPIGRTYPAREPNCRIDVFPATPPPYPTEDLASARSKCHFTSGRSACIDKLREEACASGGHAIYGFAEGVQGEYTLISATIARKVPAPASAGKAAVESKAPAAAIAGGGSCTPPCSPGYECQAGVCQALCNPACSPGFTCSADRLCRPAATP
jgi:hypothetical protein